MDYEEAKKIIREEIDKLVIENMTVEQAREFLSRKDFQESDEEKIIAAKKLIEEDEKQYAQFARNMKRYFEENLNDDDDDDDDDDDNEAAAADDTEKNKDNKENDDKDAENKDKNKDNQDTGKDAEKEKEGAKIPIKSFSEFDTIQFNPTKKTFEGKKDNKVYAGSIDEEGGIHNLECISHRLGNMFTGEDRANNPTVMGVSFQEVVSGVPVEMHEAAMKNFSEYNGEAEAAFKDPEVEKLTHNVGGVEIPYTEKEKRIIYMRRFLSVD